MVDGDDPFKTQDATVIRPRPGAGKRGVSDPLGGRPTMMPMPAAAPVPDTVREGLAIGLNPLVQAASPLLRLAGHARSASSSSLDIPGIRRQALDDLRAFEDRARAAGVPHEIVLAARYVLCATVDEAVMSTPGGSQSEWAQNPLLVALHREAWGGEKFFEMLERMGRDPARHIDLMELQYVCLALGFMGKYHTMERGHERLSEVRAGLYRTIRSHRGKPPNELALRWKGLEDRRNRLVNYIPWWIAAVGVVAILIGTFSLYQSWLAELARPVHDQLLRADLQTTAPAPVRPAAGPTLKQLLQPEEARRAVQIEEAGPKTTVTLLGADLFGSGRAELNPTYTDTLHAIASALNKVPGRVQVNGHTDDQPLRSFRYRDNYELSRERANSVVEVLKRTIDSPARLRMQGKGASEQKYQDRARNRRVEIIHVRGS
jgi:type VI secretion system protein ImpK